MTQKQLAMELGVSPSRISDYISGRAEPTEKQRKKGIRQKKGKIKKTEKLRVMFRARPVGLLSLTPDNRLNVFEYDKSWLADGFSISPLELPLN